MTKTKKLQGTIQYHELASGFWGLTDARGKHWRLTNPPDAIKKEGLKVQITAKLLPTEFSIFMWGQPVEVLDYYID